MAEKKTLIKNQEVTYKGLFKFAELYKVIEKWLKQHHYDKLEPNNYEEIFPDGKQIQIYMEPYKKTSKYAKIKLEITITGKKIREALIERNGLKQKMQEGELNISITTKMITDYEERWEMKPLFFFLRVAAEKLFLKPYIEEYDGLAKKETQELIIEIKKYLNLERFKN